MARRSLGDGNPQELTINDIIQLYAVGRSEVPDRVSADSALRWHTYVDRRTGTSSLVSAAKISFDFIIVTPKNNKMTGGSGDFLVRERGQQADAIQVVEGATFQKFYKRLRIEDLEE
jgi:hypothetical protein